ncbi:MAG: isoleucine--tRNA ligase [Desulfovibrionaceae bacterium]
MNDYKKTLHLPNTAFPMRANLNQKEPAIIQFWEENNVYPKMLAQVSTASYIVHDGPPYANGHIHMGTALNKILKDIIVKSKSMQGYHVPYVPGWDCHGLPIELRVEKEIGKEKKDSLSAVTIRKICREYAQKYVNIQRKEFKRLGIMALWEEPYLTMSPGYEADILRQLATFKEKGNFVENKKPIYWCTSCTTALAEAEIEYEDHTSDAIFVSFPITDVQNKVKCSTSIHAVIWTTTPWTLPANMAIAVHPEYEYSIVEHESVHYIIASERVKECAELFSWKEYTILELVQGKNLEGLRAKHPLYERASPIVLANYVTLESGTGLVHTAPGHGKEDYETGLRYDLQIYSPITDTGEYTKDVEYFSGKNIEESNSFIIEMVKERALLLREEKVRHSYPHCWRCRNPVIFRATRQWFIEMDTNSLRDKALKSIENEVTWLPSWGKERIYAMIEHRPDWCISRQRLWGVPIVGLRCTECSTVYNDAGFIRNIADACEQHERGIDIWYEKTVKEIHEEFANSVLCSCGSASFEKEMDILDVWFDSGTSFAAVLQKREYLSFPANLYLEGSDQHRGWFHSSLLISEGVCDSAPYKEVLTHGYVVDGKGHKMSKSVGNVIAPEEIIKKYGAEIIRLWVSSVEYKEDIRISDEILNRLVEAYRRIRNTCRYILGNLEDFSLTEKISFEDMDALDRYALSRVYKVHKRNKKYYESFEFHKIFQALHTLCSVELSSFYLDIVKDRLYSSAKKSKERKSAQSALYEIIKILLYDMAPILSFTAEEVFSYLSEEQKGGIESVLLMKMKDNMHYEISTKEERQWKEIIALRSECTKITEPMRAKGLIGHSLDAHVRISVNDVKSFCDMNTELRSVFIVSSLDFLVLAENENDTAYSEDAGFAFTILVEKAKGKKCERCWIYSEEVGKISQYSTLCPRCITVLKEEV